MNINEWEVLLPTFFLQGSDIVFKLNGNLKFINISPDYIRALNKDSSDTEDIKNIKTF